MHTILFLAFGCDQKEDTAETSNNTQETAAEMNDTSNPSNTGGSCGGIDSSQTPVVIEADFFCKVEGSGVENWIFQATVEDPQGNNTLASFQPEAGAFLNASGSQQDFIAIVCNPEGLCTAASTADTLGVGCSQADQYKIRFSIADEDGNKSEEQTLDARFEGGSTDTEQ
jgi:hypothetical protein